MRKWMVLIAAIAAAAWAGATKWTAWRYVPCRAEQCPSVRDVCECQVRFTVDSPDAPERPDTRSGDDRPPTVHP